ncbi:MAG: DNA translocase FtsK [Lachnospiraceae bacterium]|nr:DNA translocase FtsK [Lachnospiraceae bacterium]
MTAETNGFPFRDEAILLVLLAVSLILLLGNFGLAGGVDSGGNWLSNRMRGLLGVTEYIFPFVFFISACFCILNRGNRQIYTKTAVLYLVMLDIGAIVQLLRGRQFENLFDQGMSYVFSGGLLGGSIARLLYSITGFLGSLAILIIILIGCIVYLTEVSFVKGVGKRSRRMYEDTREDLKRHRKAHQEAREEQKVVQKQRMEEREEEQERRRIQREAQLEEEKEQRRIRRQKEQLRREAEAKAARIQEEKIASQMACMEQERRERKAREKQYGKTEYVNIGSISDVTLDKPKKPKKNRYQKDIHEVFMEDTAIDEAGINPQEEGLTNSFTIHRGGEVSEVQVSSSQPPKITKTEREPVKGQDAESENRKNRPAAASMAQPEQTIEKKADRVQPVIEAEYVKPDISLLKKSSGGEFESEKSLTNTGIKLQQTLQSFGVRVSVTNISCGPSVTRYELQPEQGVKVSKIVNLADDIKLNLAVEDIRIEAPIPGKAAVGIEVPNKKASPVLLGDLLDSEEFNKNQSPLSFAVGKDIGGRVVVHDVAKMPHLLIAGATGSGKSVCINTLIMSILYKADPDKVKLVMIDPKVVELSVYNGIPHMYIPVVTDPKKAAGALNWAVTEMTERYQKMAEMGVRDMKGYNAKLEQIPDSEEKPPYMPQIVIIVDELADLMMVAKHEVEDAICRLAQLARAAGIHLVIATQRPSVDVITGLIKANMPSRIALSVSSGVDSRTIIDINGAEKLLGKGDMLFYPSGYPKPVRVQGAYISDDEVSQVVDHLKPQSQGVVNQNAVEAIEECMNQVPKSAAEAPEDNQSRFDEYFADAGRFIIEKEKGSIGMLQRMFRIGFNRAARIMDQLEEAGVVGAEEGTKPRRVLMSMEEFENYIEEYV